MADLLVSVEDSVEAVLANERDSIIAGNDERDWSRERPRKERTGGCACRE
jgi:hypothetical protein